MIGKCPKQAQRAKILEPQGCQGIHGNPILSRSSESPIRFLPALSNGKFFQSHPRSLLWARVLQPTSASGMAALRSGCTGHRACHTTSPPNISFQTSAVVLLVVVVTHRCTSSSEESPIRFFQPLRNRQSASFNAFLTSSEK